jgi:excisionase family DNA binding protein
MEKICIVKRRRRDLFPVPDRMEESKERSFGTGPVEQAGFTDRNVREQTRVISMELTPEQSKAIESRMDIAPGRAFVVNLEKAGPESGHMVFSFRLAPLYGGRMLSPGEVCAMLRISRSFLAKLVRIRKLESYKIGRLRRFLFEDILHYLGHSREFPEDAA